VSRKSHGASRKTDDLATVHVYTTRSDAEIARAKLVGEGIDALVIADDEGGLNPGFYDRYGVRVVVRADQIAAARTALGIESLTVPDDALEAMIQHARSAAPEEACGLFAVGHDGAVTMVYCLTNAEPSPTAYTIDPTEHHDSWEHARRNGWEIGGVFHSHPASAAVPSAADLVGLDPDWVSVIVGATEIRAYRVSEGEATEVVVQRG
jgi:proteasome lid subunit RPN8/RPN11